MLIRSLNTIDSPLSSFQEVIEWIEKKNRDITVKVERIRFDEMESWESDKDGSLRHVSGKFFSIEGIQVKTDFHTVKRWTQPIINQPEVGFLGIIVKEFDGILYFLMQAKVEPGNVNCVQISPTLQATKSNYTQVHKGKSPAYLDYFVNAKKNQILIDQLQSEQGARFLRKRNRNIIIKVDEDVPLMEGFRWLTLGQIKMLMLRDNVVNMDTRTVLSALNIASYVTPFDELSHLSHLGEQWMTSVNANTAYYSINDHLSWLSSLKSKFDIHISGFPIVSMDDWHYTPYELARYDELYFRVIAVRVSISNREVVSWCQPLVEPKQKGICGLIVKKINGVAHFLIQAKMECGNFDTFELAPTVQCLTGRVKEDISLQPPYYSYFMSNGKSKILYDVWQSEEGGRFYHEQNRNMIVQVDDDFPIETPELYTWMTLGQIYEFMRFNNYLNIQIRSLISILPYIDAKI